MARTMQLSSWAEKVAGEAIAGRQMQPKLAELANTHDFDAREVQLVAEMANRMAQREIYKLAEDKRFKFALADATALNGERRKAATASNRGTGATAKMAAAINEAGGDPFAPLPAKSNVDSLSLLQVPLNEKLAEEIEEAEIRGMLLQLDKHRNEFLALKEAGVSATLEIEGAANMAHDTMIESALSLLRSGVTLVDLYSAMRAAVSGTAAGPDAMKQVDELALLLIDGIKDRGFPNSRLGFRYMGGIPNTVEELSSEDILALAKRASGIPDQCGMDINMQTQKKAQQIVTLVQRVYGTGGERHPFEDAASDLGFRSSTQTSRLPAHYLDETHVSNTPNGKPIVLNGDAQFVIGVRDLVGARDRLLKTHAAKEYVGLKLKQIEEAMRGVRDRGAKKEALLPALAAAGRAALTAAPALLSMGADTAKPKQGPSGMTVHSSAGAAKESGAGQVFDRALGVANVVGMGLPFVLSPKPPKQPKDQKVQNQPAGMAAGMP